MARSVTWRGVLDTALDTSSTDVRVRRRFRNRGTGSPTVRAKHLRDPRPRDSNATGQFRTFLDVAAFEHYRPLGSLLHCHRGPSLVILVPYASDRAPEPVDNDGVGHRSGEPHYRSGGPIRHALPRVQSSRRRAVLAHRGVRASQPPVRLGPSGISQRYRRRAQSSSAQSSTPATSNSVRLASSRGRCDHPSRVSPATLP